MDPVVVNREAGEAVVLGPVKMRLLISAAQANGTLAVAEFRGGEGPWTVPHVHRELEEAFYVLDGGFAFTLGDDEVQVRRGDFVLVPRGTPHIMRGEEGGGALLTMWAPGGLEEMFLELGRMPAASLTDPEKRAEVAKRFDSIPV